MYRFEEIKTNPELQKKIMGAMIIRTLIREWFTTQGFLEVETPLLVATPGQEPYLDPFELTVRDERGTTSPGYLITSPEYALKKLLAAGLPKIFDLGRAFRNGELAGGLHNPEFTLLEWYRASASYRDIMGDTEQLVFYIFQKLNANRYTLNAHTDYTPPWERLTVREAFRQYADMDLDSVLDPVAFRDILRGRGNAVRGDETFEECFHKIFLTYIEPRLGQGRPTFLYDYPAPLAALAKLKPDDPRYAERVEVYVNGIELANGYSELRSADEQRARFLEEQNIRRGAGRPAHPLDEEFLAALANGFPESSGIALGVDRLAMILLDASSIREVIFFPWPR